MHIAIAIKIDAGQTIGPSPQAPKFQQIENLDRAWFQEITVAYF